MTPIIGNDSPTAKSPGTTLKINPQVFIGETMGPLKQTKLFVSLSRAGEEGKCVTFLFRCSTFTRQLFNSSVYPYRF